MSSSGSDFDDDDDELLQALLQGEADVQDNQVIPTQAPVPTHTEIQVDPFNQTEQQARLFRADGEIAILRAQLQQIQQQKQDEIQQLRDSYASLKHSNDEQVSALKHAVQKLEDEKKFLNNELLAASYSHKKRKMATDLQVSGKEGDNIDGSKTQVPQDDLQEATPPPTALLVRPIQKVIKIANDSALLTDQLWNHCIPGSKRTSFKCLSKICADFDIHMERLEILKRTSFSSSIVEFLLLRKNHRLDQLLEEFTLTMLDLIKILLEHKAILLIPFLFSLVHCAISFRPAAMSVDLITKLLQKSCVLAHELSYFVNSNQDEDDLVNYHDVPYQIMVLEKFIFLCCLDVIEMLFSLSSTHDSNSIKSIWHVFPLDLFQLCLPNNPERFKNTAQINLVFNIVELLISSITEDSFGFNTDSLDKTVIDSLLKVFIIEIPLKENFMFYGLNRIIGNNTDYQKIEAMVPVKHDFLNNYQVAIPLPVPFELQRIEDKHVQFELRSNHEFHLLNLRVRIGELLESLVVTKENINFLTSKEHFKSMIRIIGFEQIYIARSPRSKYIYLRIRIIAILVRLIKYLIQDVRDVTALIYPETLNELYVVLLRIAFGSDSISLDAHKMLLRIRTKGFVKEPIFNPWCEEIARDLNHITPADFNNGKVIADLESDFANGLEFPYDSETVELSREILNGFVTHEEADNLYFNVNNEDEEVASNFDEMELVE